MNPAQTHICLNGTKRRPDIHRVLVVDDHQIFVQMLSYALSVEPDMECVGMASNGADALLLAATLQPTLLVMDITMPGLDGLTATRQVREVAPNTVIVIATGHFGVEWVVEATRAGASAFVSKYGSLVEMLDVMRRACPGSMLVAPSTFSPDVTASAPLPALTPREYEVLTHLGRGVSPKIIARTLGISISTCRGYVMSLQEKLDARSALEAVVKAQRLGLLDAGG